MGERRKETFELMAKFNHSRRAKVAVARNSAAAAQITNVSATTTAAAAATGGGSEQRGRPGVVFAVAAPLSVAAAIYYSISFFAARRLSAARSLSLPPDIKLNVAICETYLRWLSKQPGRRLA
jgi:hypothetical protein